MKNDMEIIDNGNYVWSNSLGIIELLRKLNVINVNEIPTVRDDLFSLLTVVEDINKFYGWLDRGASQYLKIIDYSNGNVRIYVDDSKDKPFENFNVDVAFSHYRAGKLSYDSENDYIKYDCGTIGYNKPYFNTLYALLTMRSIIMEDNLQFDSFKSKVIELLIKKVCESKWEKRFYNSKKETINKLMVILAEHITRTSPSDIYPWVLTDELLEELEKIPDKKDWPNIIINYTLTNTVQQFSSPPKRPSK